MTFQVLLVAGTHGNEINAPMLLDQWAEDYSVLKTHDLKIVKKIGNPLALRTQRRYIDRDLNRSFSAELFEAFSSENYEISRGP